MKEAIQLGHFDEWAAWANGGGDQPLDSAAYARAAREIIRTMAAMGYNATSDFPPCVVFKGQSSLTPHHSVHMPAQCSFNAHFTRSFASDRLFSFASQSLTFLLRCVELMEVYPNAKVVLTVREKPADWAASMAATIALATHYLSHPPFTYMPRFRGFSALSSAMWRAVGVNCDAPGLDNCRNVTALSTEEAMEVYEKWNAYVIATVPADRLLIFKVGDGWAPLCKFLGFDNSTPQRQCPSTAYPSVNDRASFQAMVATFALMNRYWSHVLIVAVMVVLYVTVRVLRSCCGASKSSKADAAKKRA